MKTTYRANRAGEPGEVCRSDKIRSINELAGFLLAIDPSPTARRMAAENFDVSVYAVTDTPLNDKHSRALLDAVLGAILGGATFLQVRDKSTSAGSLTSQVAECMVLVKIARNDKLSEMDAKMIQESTRLDSAVQKLRARMPLPSTSPAPLRLVVNDRVDVAIASGCDGAHVGQSDIPAGLARKLLGPNKILGVTAATAALAAKAIDDGADYVGAGAVFGTATKNDTSVITTADLVDVCAAAWPAPVVAIGGIKHANCHVPLLCDDVPAAAEGPGAVAAPIYRVLPAGVAVVSAIFDAADIEAATRELVQVVNAAQLKQFQFSLAPVSQLLPSSATTAALVAWMGKLLTVMRSKCPLVHCITNWVAMDLTANLLLAAGASPAMVSDPLEAPAFTKIASALLINIGTLQSANLPVMQAAAQSAVAAGKPWVLDPVACGATEFRKLACVTLSSNGTARPSVIRGNASEILALSAAVCGNASAASGGRGVDSTSDSTGDAVRDAAVALANVTGGVVAVSGSVDLVVGPSSVGNFSLHVSNGSPMLTKITAAGCALTALVAAACAAAPDVDGDLPVQLRAGQESSLGVVRNMCATAFAFALFGSATDISLRQPHVSGPASLRTQLVDTLYTITEEQLMKEAKLQVKGA